MKALVVLATVIAQMIYGANDIPFRCIETAKDCLTIEIQITSEDAMGEKVPHWVNYPHFDYYPGGTLVTYFPKEFYSRPHVTGFYDYVTKKRYKDAYGWYTDETVWEKVHCSVCGHEEATYLDIAQYGGFECSSCHYKYRKTQYYSMSGRNTNKKCHRFVLIFNRGTPKEFEGPMFSYPVNNGNLDSDSYMDYVRKEAWEYAKRLTDDPNSFTIMKLE